MLAASLLTLPPPMTGLHLLWFSCVSVPVLSTSLVNSANDSDLMTMIMAKNDKNFVVSYFFLFGRLSGWNHSNNDDDDDNDDDNDDNDNDDDDDDDNDDNDNDNNDDDDNDDNDNNDDNH